MASRHELSSSPVSPEQARNLVLSLERQGLDTGRIHVETAAPATTIETSRVDRRTVARPGRRVAIGFVVGLAVGITLGLIAATLLDISIGAAVVPSAVGVAIVGALVGLYARLPTSAEISDADSGRLAAVRIDVSGLPDDEVDDIAAWLKTA